MMDSVYPQPLSRLHRRAVRKKFHKNSARYRTQPVTFAEIQEVDEESVNDDTQLTGTSSKSDLDLKAKFEEFKRQRDRDLCENRLGSKQKDNVILSENIKIEVSFKESENKEPQSLSKSSTAIGLSYRGSSSCPRTSV